MNRIIGPTRPVFGSPASLTPNPPTPPTGNGPFSMKSAVMKPQAMKAAMFGMIIPERNVPNFWTATLAPDPRAGAVVDALTGVPPGGDHGHRLARTAPAPPAGIPAPRTRPERRRHPLVGISQSNSAGRDQRHVSALPLSTDTKAM